MAFTDTLPKPLLRGLFHLFGLLIALFAGGVLVGSAEGMRARLGALVYALSLATMFGASTLYHRTNFRPQVERWLERADHAAIFLFIGGTYTPLCLLLEQRGRLVLALVWGMAALGVARAFLWVHAPHWLSVCQYLLVGWTILPFVAELWQVLGTQAVALLFAGGALYSLGAVIFARKRPDPFPAVFGFHEIFHALVVGASICHFVVVASAIDRLG